MVRVVETAVQRDDAMEPKVADLGRYRLVAELARGGMGIVYLALVRGPAGFNKLFVLKVLKSHLAEDPKLVDMFLDEARIAARLSHPNVVQTIEVGSDGGRHFIAMEFLDGQSHYRLLARCRRTGLHIPLEVRLHVIVQVLEALQYTHSLTDFDGTPLDLVHRDVSPHNVVLTYDGQVKILDFGIAKALDSSTETRTGMLKGKIAYMAPEQATGESLDRRADLFAVGAMLWEAAVGERMWDRSLNDLQILHALMHGAIPRPRDVKPDVDPRLERMILKATAVKPADRYANAAEMQGDVEAFIDAIGAPTFGPRDVGRFVSEVFAEERAQMKAVVDGQLRVLRRTSSGEYARIDMPQLAPLAAPSGTPSGVQLPPARRSIGVAALVAVTTALLLAAFAAVLILRGRAFVPAGAAQPASRAVNAAPAPSDPPAASSVAPAPPIPQAAAKAEPTVTAPRQAWIPRAVDAVRMAASGTVQPATAASAPPAAASAQPPQAAASAHVRQPIDTNDPYGP